MDIIRLFPRGTQVGQLNPAALRTVEAAGAYFRARTVVALGAERGTFTLLAASGGSDGCVKALLRVATARRNDLEQGHALSGRAQEVETNPTGSFVLAPAIDGEQLVGVLYVETDGPALSGPKDLGVLGQFCRLLVTALEEPVIGAPSVLAGERSDEAACQQLLTLLELHEWNIARVARELHTTRTTIYKRLERYGATRRRVPKTARRPRLA